MQKFALWQFWIEEDNLIHQKNHHVFGLVVSLFLLERFYIPISTGITIGALLVRWKRNPATTSVRLFFT